MKYFIILICFFLFIPMCLSAYTHRVDINGGADYTAIGAAITAAANNDTILVAPGRYVENLKLMGKSLTLLSFEAITDDSTYIDSTIIDGNRNGTCIEIFADERNTHIQGFSITNGSGNDRGDGITAGGGIIVSCPDNNEFYLINCKIFDNLASGGGGMYISKDTTTAYLENVQIYDNKASINGGALYIYKDVNITFSAERRCSIYNNFARNGLDILCDYNSPNFELDLVLDKFTVTDPDVYFVNNINYAPGINEEEDFTFTYDILQGHLDEINHDLYVSMDGDDNNTGLSPADPLYSITRACYIIESDSLNPKTVYMAAGDYSPQLTDEYALPTVKSHTNLVGAGSGETILTSSSYIATVNKSVNCSNTEFRGLYINNSRGSGIGTGQCNKFSLFDIIIENSQVERWGGFTLTEVDTLYMEEVIVRNNIANANSGGASVSGGTIIIRDCEFSYNEALERHGLFNALDIMVEDSLYIGNTKFIGNMDNGAANSNALTVIAQDYCTPSVFLENNLFAENISTNSSAVASLATRGGRIWCYNNTFANNIADNDVTLYISGSQIDISNNIFYNNDTDTDILNCLNQRTIFDSNLLPGGTSILRYNDPNYIRWSDTNIDAVDADPLFAGDAGTYAYSLLPDSPCIDTGAALDTIWATDIIGMARVFNSTIDMGCYEYPGYVNVHDQASLAPQAITLTNYPNPFNPSTSISFDMPELGEARLEIYNIRGQRVVTLFSGHADVGVNTHTWQGTDEAGKQVGSGVYFSRVTTKDTSVTKKMLLLK